MPKTVDTRSHCKVWLRACNNLPQPPPYISFFWGLRKIVACSQPYLAVASCIYSFWHGVIPTSYLIFTLVYIQTTLHICYDITDNDREFSEFIGKLSLEHFGIQQSRMICWGWREMGWQTSPLALIQATQYLPQAAE